MVLKSRIPRFAPCFLSPYFPHPSRIDAHPLKDYGYSKNTRCEVRVLYSDVKQRVFPTTYALSEASWKLIIEEPHYFHSFPSGRVNWSSQATRKQLHWHHSQSSGMSLTLLEILTPPGFPWCERITNRYMPDTLLEYIRAFTRRIRTHMNIITYALH